MERMSMKVLPSRAFNPRQVKADRLRFLPHGLMHPAKMHVKLALDLFARYTRPGQTVLDPCLGVGTSLLGILLGRNVVGIELEPHHHRDALANAEHISKIAEQFGRQIGYWLAQGDSREVIPELFGTPTGVDATVTSGAFGEMNAPHRGGDIKQRPNKDGVGFEGGKEFFTYDGQPAATITSPAYGPQLPDGSDPQVAVERIRRKVASGELTHPEGNPGGVGRRTAWGGGQVRTYTTGYGVDSTVTSVPYEKVASRDRHSEPSASKDPDRAAKYGDDDPSRHVSGYGKNPAQIGNMKLKDHSYQDAMQDIYAKCLNVTRDGGVLVTVTGNYIDKGEIIDLAQVTIDLCVNAGWTPCERWQAVKRNAKGTPSVSFWRTLQAKQGMPLIDYEDCLVFCKGPSPAWEFASLDGGRWP
jgi:DNA methylase